MPGTPRLLPTPPFGRSRVPSGAMRQELRQKDYDTADLKGGPGKRSSESSDRIEAAHQDVGGNENIRREGVSFTMVHRGDWIRKSVPCSESRLAIAPELERSD